MTEKSLFKEENSLRSLKSGFHTDISGVSANNEGGIRVGNEYQADLPDCLSLPYIKGTDEPLSIMVWHPNADHLDLRVDHYLEIAAEKFGYNQEQALGLLFWHHHNVDKSLSDLPNFVPFPEHWDTMDQVLFEQAFAFYGKNFHRIHSMMPEKSVGSLVRYYYLWKRLRNKTSKMDQKTENTFKKFISSGSSSSSGSDSPQDNEIKPVIYIQSKGGNRSSKKSQPGVYLDIKDLQQTGSVGFDDCLKKLESELSYLLRKVVSMKASINHYKLKNNLNINHLRPPEAKFVLNPKWTEDEMLLSVIGFSRFGKDFEKIGETIGTKNEGLVEDFFHNYRQRYNLDFAIAEFQRDYCKETYRNKDKIASGKASTEKFKNKDEKRIVSHEEDEINIVNPTLDLSQFDTNNLNSSMDANKLNMPVHQLNQFNASVQQPNQLNLTNHKNRESNRVNFQSQFDRYNQLRAQYGADYFSK